VSTPPEILAGTPRPASIDGATVPGDPPGRPALVEVRQATAVLGGRTVWSGVDATVAAGQFVAVLGPNGVGKSTLLKALLGLIPLAAGQHPAARPAAGAGQPPARLPAAAARLRRLAAGTGRGRGPPWPGRRPVGAAAAGPPVPGREGAGAGAGRAGRRHRLRSPADRASLRRGTATLTDRPGAGPGPETAPARRAARLAGPAQSGLWGSRTGFARVTCCSAAAWAGGWRP
jgi:energy-coupling factor transporter ATP-binding protein EcfA2